MTTIAQTTEQQLPAPQTRGGKTLMEALTLRQTQRDFLPQKEIDAQTLSNLLWATWGINRPQLRKRTAPTAINSQAIDVYVATAQALWRYDAKENKLLLHKKGDLRCGKFKEAPVLFYYVAPPGDGWAKAHAGSLYQNAGLYCASIGLGNVVIGFKQTLEEIQSRCELPAGREVVVAQAFGWTK